MMKPLTVREGMRVRNVSFCSGAKVGELGTVATVATGRGKSIYPDPSRVMVFVQWDDGRAFGVFRNEVERA